MIHLAQHSQSTSCWNNDIVFGFYVAVLILMQFFLTDGAVCGISASRLQAGPCEYCQLWLLQTPGEEYEFHICLGFLQVCVLGVYQLTRL